MERITARVLERSIRGKGAGELVTLSRRDAQVLARLGRVELLGDEAPDAKAERRTPVRKDKKARKSSPRKRSLATPEASLGVVAHTDAPESRTAGRSRKAK